MIKFVSFRTKKIMKKIFSLLLFFYGLFGFAQLDTDHWFAPIPARAGIGGYEGYLYLSTNETTPFQVTIYSNNSVFTTTTISKGNPAQISIPSNLMMGLPQADLFTSSTKGLNLKASKKFFANYRFAITNHAEIITSKGLAGLGTTFYAGMAPNTAAASYVSSAISVIATEDNTVVTLSNYDPGVIFSDGISSPTRTFTLNKGQSYMMDVVSTATPSNLEGLVGAKIVATKPISVTNGNFNGIYTVFNSSNNDVLMDQSVPTDRLGKDFVVVKGNGPVSSGMEAVLVIATENATQLNVNGSPFGLPLNEGDFTIIPGTSYINQGSGHYNVGINADKNIYVYQLLTGTASGNVYPAGGFNYIPPLSCFLPNKVDEVGFINSIGFTTYDTKLNIITQTGAAVTLNGTALAASTGPFPVSGNPNWVSYSVPNVTGTVTVNSTKSVTAGIAAGSGAVGYGGYFAGFSSVPSITKTGDCYTGIRLQVDNSYDSYQWYYNDVAIPGANTYFINPELYGAGNYTVLITKNNCESKLTLPYNYTLCPPITTSTHTIGSCKNLIISPAFTNSTQPINPAATNVVGAPTNGTTSVNTTTGQITYTPNTGLTADTTDQFVYYIEGTGNPATFEYFKVIVNIDVLQTNNAALAGCAGSNGNGLFDLTSVSVSPDTGTTSTYYSNASLTNQISAPTAYSSPSGTVYVNVSSAFGCTKVAQINLTVNPSPNINTANYNGTICDVNFDGIIPVDFSTVTPQIVNSSANFNVRYYLVQADATAGNNNNLPNNWTYNANTVVYVRVDPTTGGCPPVFGQISFAIGDKVTLTTLDATTSICDNNLDNTENVNLNDYKNLFTANPLVTLSFYSTLNNAQNEVSPINASQNITAAGGVFYIRFQVANGCPNIAKLTINLIQPTTSSTLVNQTICANTTTTLNAGSGFTAYLWSNGATTPTITVGPGNYFVDLTSPNGCVYRQNVSVTGITQATINPQNFNTALCDDNFDGTVNLNFYNVTQAIVSPLAGMNISYFLSNADAIANVNALPLNYSFTTTTTIYVRVQTLNGVCPPVYSQLTFTIGNKVPLITQAAVADICDIDLSGSESVNLTTFKNLFTADPTVSLTFFNNLADAQNNANSVPATQNISGTSVFFVRFTSPNFCPSTAQLTVSLKSPQSSSILMDKTICPGTQTVLDAGPGFTSYLWSNGLTTSSITVGVGNYYVDLSSANGCVYRQHVVVSAAPTAVITSVDVNGSNVTVNVTGGTPPYQYSLDGVNYQDSNIFTGLRKGFHTVYVISADRCEPVKKDFTILGLLNAITPNDDGINDVLDYSELSLKENVSIEIYDRYGALIHKSKAGNYVWDGKLRGLPLNTDSYWYKIQWTEPDTKENVIYTGWILVKNR